MFKMDMLSLCRKRVANDSPEARRRSPRIARKGQPSAAKKTAMNGDKCFANIDATLPAVSHSQNGNVILRIFTKPGDEKSRITDVTNDHVEIKVTAKAEDSHVNAELIRYLASVLEVQRTNISIEKGIKAQLKVAIVNKNGLTVDRVKRLIDQALGKGIK